MSAGKPGGQDSRAGAAPGSAPAGGAGPMRADARRNRARILAAAEKVFAEHGPSGSTEQVAAEAGVAIGTVFRHFPTKQALLQAIMKNLLAGLAAQARDLAGQEDPADGIFTFFASLVRQAAEKKTVVELLANAGIDVPVADSVQTLRQGIATLLVQAQRTGAVRDDVRLDVLVALLASACQGAVQSGWSPDLQDRILAVIFDGLRRPDRPYQRACGAGS